MSDEIKCNVSAKTAKKLAREVTKKIAEMRQKKLFLSNISISDEEKFVLSFKKD